MRARPYGQPAEGQQEPRDVVQSESTNRTASPAGPEVAKFHRNSDVDSRPEAQHHTLGPLPSQASPGDHNHRDNNSAPLLEGITLTGSKAGANVIVLSSIVAALKALGATDSTS